MTGIMKKNKLALYIHLPWCIRKCPYCDFNSFKAPLSPNYDAYLQALKEDFISRNELLASRTIDSIFFGGGTPNLFSPEHISDIILFIRNNSNVDLDCEITMEANPGSSEHSGFLDYLNAGVNRFSIGCQSFNPQSLKKIGRIHTGKEAIDCIRSLPASNTNIDIMHSLPSQNTKMALEDLQQAIDLNPQHISWYELTLEPNTIFAKYPPKLPCDKELENIYEQGLKKLKDANYQRYEISAFSKPGFECRHNLHYWNFDDYLGIGAGAASKITLSGKIHRFNRTKSPLLYMKQPQQTVKNSTIDSKTTVFEYMLNRTRILKPIKITHFEQKTLQSIKDYKSITDELLKSNLINLSDRYITITPKGNRFLNSIQEAFLP
jgi:putative oxygen-independent coproporphyrinogen III oxidase